MFSKADKETARAYASDEVTGSVDVTPAATPVAVSTSGLPS